MYVRTMSSGLFLDMSLHPYNVIPVFQALTGDWKKIANYTIVPDARAQRFRERFSVPDQCTEAGRYYALYHRDPNWKELSCHLYEVRETEALQIARPHIQTVIGTMYMYMQYCPAANSHKHTCPTCVPRSPLHVWHTFVHACVMPRNT